MPGRLAIDFGTSNTVVAVWDEALQEGVPLHVPDYGQLYQQGSEKISVIPSQIHYGADRRRWLGYQIQQKQQEPHTYPFAVNRAVRHREVLRRRLKWRNKFATRRRAECA